MRRTHRPEVGPLVLHPMLLIGALLTVVSVLASRVSARLGLPALLLFLGVGMLAGSEGPGGIWFDDAVAAQNIATLALVYILFAGGLETRWSEARGVAGSALALATVGVVLTASAVGVFAWAVLDLPPLVGLLLGAIVASTDAAAVFAQFAGSGARLEGRLRPLLELESGSNDPMAVFLTTAILSLITIPGSDPLALIPELVSQMTLGALAGLASGRASGWIVNRAKLGAEGLYPVLTLALALLTYGGTAALGGNGFLAVYVAGVVLGSADLLHKHSLIQFHDGLAWLMQIGMFLTLGLLVFPSQLLPVAGQGIAVALFLMLVARPAAVMLVLAPTTFTIREKLMISWVGLRGAVPIVLATFPLVAGIPEAGMLFNVVFFIVIASSLLQGTTLVTVARRLGLEAPPQASRPIDPGVLGPVAGLLREVPLPPHSPAAGRAIVDLHVPRHAVILLVFRGAEFVLPRGATVLQAGDRLLVLAQDDALAELAARLLTVPAPATSPPTVASPPAPAPDRSAG